MILKSAPPARPVPAPAPPPVAPLPSAPPAGVAPWRVALVLGSLVLAFLLGRSLGWGVVILFGWIAASEFVAICRQMAGASRAVHEGGPPEVR